MLRQAGFLGTGASLAADLTLLAEGAFFLALVVGVIAQRRRRYKLHDWIQTPVVALNLVFIIFIMAGSFVSQRVAATLPQRPGDAYYLVVAVHAGLGLAAEGLAIYCLLAGHQILPRKFGRLRYWMWTTFGFWTAAVAFGAGTYYVWYVRQPETVTAAAPAEGEQVIAAAAGASRQILLQNFAFEPSDLAVPAGTAVTWLNQDGAPHNITLVDGDVASENFFQGDAFTTTFDTPGTYHVYCTLHGNADGSGMAMTITVVEAGEEDAAQVAQPAAQAAPPTLTPAPTVPPPPAALLQRQAGEPAVLGSVSFFDHAAPSDSVRVLLDRIQPPASGAELRGWLTDSRGGTALDLGRVQPAGDGSLFHLYTDEPHRNLPGLYDGFQITQEPQFDDDPTPGPVLYQGRLPGEALATIRALTVETGDAPGGQSYALGARRQTEELLRHVEYAQIAFDRLNLADARRHAEHIVNLLEGEEGEFFGDLDGAYGPQNPGDGFGIIPYVRRVRAAAEEAGAAGDATQAIRTHAGHVVIASDNAVDWALFLRGSAQEILAARRIGEVGPQMAALYRYGRLMLDGEDGNGDGEIAPAEGGIFTAYQHAQYMAAIPVTAGQTGASNGPQ